LDDLFGAPAAPATAAPATEAMPKVDDLFGTPAAPATEAPAPAADGAGKLDDLFGAPAAPAAEAAPAADLFGAPAEPAPTQPGAAADDIFGAPAPAADAPPASETKSSLDDLFNFNSDRPAAESGTASAAIAPEKAGSDPDFEALFGNPVSLSTEPSPASGNDSLPAEPAAPAEAAPANPDSFDDLFKTSSAPLPPVFRGAEFRTWVDNTGDYQVNARLVMIYPDRIRLIKDNGKFSTVPMSRLSQPDLAYVQWVAYSLTGAPKEKLVTTERDGGKLQSDLQR
jgi:hypothetical protein